jgi:hypothetical protein
MGKTTKFTKIYWNIAKAKNSNLIKCYTDNDKLVFSTPDRFNSQFTFFFCKKSPSHMRDFNHTFDFEDTEILDMEQNSNKLSVVELLCINEISTPRSIASSPILKASVFLSGALPQDR